MAIKKLVSIKEAFLQAVEDTDENTKKMYPVLARWAKQKDQRIGGFYNYQRRYKLLEITNDVQVKLPESAVHVNAILMGDHMDNVPDVFNGVPTYNVSTDGNNLTYRWEDISDYNNIVACYPWYIQNNTIIFERKPNETEVTIDLLEYPTDKDGFIMVMESHIDPLAKGLIWEMSKKELWHRFRKDRLTGANMKYIKELESEYRRAVRQIKSDDETTEQHMRELSDMIGFEFTGNASLNLYG